MTGTKAVMVLCVAVALVPASAVGAPPTIVREEVDETFVDEALSEECGVVATVHLTGHQISRTREGGGVLEVFTVNLTGTITSDFGSFKVKDVGSDATRITPDGQVIVSVRGQVPFFFKGVWKFDGTTEEWLHEPNLAAGERQIDRACARLNPRARCDSRPLGDGRSASIAVPATALPCDSGGPTRGGQSPAVRAPYRLYAHSAALARRAVQCVRTKVPLESTAGRWASVEEGPSGPKRIMRHQPIAKATAIASARQGGTLRADSLPPTTLAPLQSLRAALAYTVPSYRVCLEAILSARQFARGASLR